LNDGKTSQVSAILNFGISENSHIGIHKSRAFLEAKNETINIDPAELSDARWMSEERNRNGGVGGFDGLTAVLESLDRSGHQEDFIQV